VRVIHAGRPPGGPRPLTQGQWTPATEGCAGNTHDLHNVINGSSTLQRSQHVQTLKRSHHAAAHPLTWSWSSTRSSREDRKVVTAENSPSLPSGRICTGHQRCHGMVNEQQGTL
jgi:hypothetical protein